jgi:hypothetical protein
MFGNVVTMDYKDPESLKTVVAALSKEAKRFNDAPGFRAMHMVRTGPTQTVHTVVFDNEENFKATRDKMFPVLLQIAEPHVTRKPQQAPGPVVLATTDAQGVIVSGQR